MIRSTMWIYPWDIIDIGVDEVLDEVMTEAKVGGLSIATAYHAGRFLQPRSPRRKVYFPEDGTVYFEPDAKAYRESLLKPVVSSVVSEGRDILRELEGRRRKRGFTLNGWTVCLHNTRLGMLHPEATTRNAYGDSNYYNLCPSNPLNVSYLAALVKDLTSRYSLDSVELESPNFMGFAHEYHHEKDGVGLTDYGDFLMSLCFCDDCMKKARDCGVDAKAAQDTVRRLLDQVLERETPISDPGFVARGIDGFADHAALRGFLAWRFTPVTELCSGLRAAASPSTAVYFLSLVTQRAWLHGIDIGAIGRVCDGLVVCAYDSPAPKVARDIAEAYHTMPADRYLSAGFRVFHPETRGPDDLRAKVTEAVRVGAKGLNFYNFGLIPRARLAWVRAAVEGVA